MKNLTRVEKQIKEGVLDRVLEAARELAVIDKEGGSNASKCGYYAVLQQVAQELSRLSSAITEYDELMAALAECLEERESSEDAE